MKRPALAAAVLALGTTLVTPAFAANTYVAPTWAPNAFNAQALPATTPTDPNSATIVSSMYNWITKEDPNNTRFGLDLGDGYSNPLITARNTDPVYDIKVIDWNGVQHPEKEQYLKGVHIPVDAKPATGTDKQLSVYNADTGRYIDLWGARFQNGQWIAASGGSIDNTKTSNTVFPHPEEGAYTSASGIALWPYTITPSELKSGVINHPLALQIPGHWEDGGLSSPAVAHDAWATGKPISNYTVSIGQRLRLPASLNIDAMNMPKASKTIAKALQKYGAIVVDSTASDDTKNGTFYGNFKFSTQNPADFTTDVWSDATRDPHYADWSTAGYFLFSGAKGSYDRFPFDKMQVLPRNYAIPTTAIAWNNKAISNSAFRISDTGAPAGSTLKVSWTLADNTVRSATSTNVGSYTNSSAPGWVSARASIVGSTGKVLSSSPVLKNPYATAPVNITWTSNAYDANSFDFKATGAPAGSSLRVSWTKAGSVTTAPATTSMYFYSGTQTGWSNARAEVLDSTGKVIATSALLNPPGATGTSAITWSKSWAHTDGTFEMVATGAPAGAQMKVYWVKGGATTSITTSSMDFYSGNQSGYTSVYGQVIDATGKVVSTSPTLTPSA